MKSIKAATDINIKRVYSDAFQAIKQTVFLAHRVSSQSNVHMKLLQM